MKNEKWIEVENLFLDNRPATTIGRGTSRRQVADPSAQATEAYLFCYRCWLTPKQRRVKRSRFLKTITGQETNETMFRLQNFVERDDVMLIPTVKNPREHIACGVRVLPV